MGKTRESEDRKTKQISSVKLQKNICHEIIVSTNIDHDWMENVCLATSANSYFLFKYDL